MRQRSTPVPPLGAARRRLRIAMACAVTLFAALGARSEAATCLSNPIYSVSLTNTNVFSIDPQNGFAVTQLPNAAPFVSAAAARSPIDGRIYMIGFNQKAGAVPFGYYDPATNSPSAASTLTGAINAADYDFVRAGFSQNGTLYAESDQTQTLYSITTGGVAAVVGTLSGLPISTGDLAFDPVNPNVFYATDVNAAENGGNGAIDIYRGTLNPLAVTLLGDSGINTKTVYGLAFGNDGVLYADDEAASTLYRIDTTSGLASPAATVTIAGGAYDLASIPQAANLTVLKKHTGAVKAGGTIAYTLTVANAANATCTLTSLTLSDPLPASLVAPITYTAATGTYTSSSGAWTGLSLAPGGSTTLTITAAVAPTASGTISNKATVSAPGVENTATVTDSTDLAPLAQLTKSVLNITSSPAGTPATSNDATPGQKLRYFLTFTNNTSVALVNPSISDTVPANTTYVAEACPAATTALPPNVTCAFSPAAPTTGMTITYQFTGTFQPGATIQVSLDVQVI